MFNGLLPGPHNSHSLDVLFELGHWHGLAKLCMHTNSSLQILHDVTTSLGSCVRKFIQKMCSAFQTHELEREWAVWQRRQEREAASCQQQSNQVSEARSRTTMASTQIPKILNLRRYSYCLLGDYMWTIQHFGTTDSYTTQQVSNFLMLVPCFLQVTNYRQAFS